MTRAEQDGAPELAGPRHHGNRWGRSEQARQAVLEAADDLLAERGFAGVTIEGIATAAGVAKQTIYRWWNSKTDILMDALLQDAAEALTPPDHADFREALGDQLSRVAAFLTRTDAGAVCRALIGQAQHDAGTARALRQRYFEPQRRAERGLLERGVTSGELSGPFDVDAALDALCGPIVYRALMGTPVPRRFVDGLVADVLGPHRG